MGNIKYNLVVFALVFFCFIAGTSCSIILLGEASDKARYEVLK